jgi:hypothetical protein
VNDDIKFGTLHPDGTLTNQRSLPKAAVAACPQYILVPEHYREDNTCRCDEGHYDDETGEWVEVPLAEYQATLITPARHRDEYDPEPDYDRPTKYDIGPDGEV